MNDHAMLLPIRVRVWSADWEWGLPLIVVTLVIHVLGLLLISERVERIRMVTDGRYSANAVFVVMIGITAMGATCLHSVEAMIWGIAYMKLGALADWRSAVLYSLNAMTAYGHTVLRLEQRWELLGALEALNGMLLFGLTTATLFAIIQKTRGAHGKRPL